MARHKIPPRGGKEKSPEQNRRPTGEFATQIRENSSGAVMPIQKRSREEKSAFMNG